MEDSDEKNSISSASVSDDFNFVTFTLTTGENEKKMTDTIRAKCIYRVRDHSQTGVTSVYWESAKNAGSINVQHSSEEVKEMINAALSREL